MGANYIQRHGRLTRDPEERKYNTKDGNEGVMASFGVAVSNSYGAKTETSFYDCNVFGKRAEAILKYFRKGSEIVVRGEFEQYEYEKDGQKRRKWSLTVGDFDFCGSRSDNGAPADDSIDVTEHFQKPLNDDDIPF